MKTNLPVTQTELAFPKGRYIVPRTDLKGITVKEGAAQLRQVIAYFRFSR